MQSNASARTATVQGYLAHENPPPHSSMLGTYGDPGGVGSSYVRGTKVGPPPNTDVPASEQLRLMAAGGITCRWSSLSFRLLCSVQLYRRVPRVVQGRGGAKQRHVRMEVVTLDQQGYLAHKKRHPPLGPP